MLWAINLQILQRPSLQRDSLGGERGEKEVRERRERGEREM